MANNRILDKINDISLIPNFVSLHLSVVPNTYHIEQQAKELIQQNFYHDRLLYFTKEIHAWGGTYRNLNKVLDSIKPQYFIDSWAALCQTPPQIGLALTSVMRVNGLGISYASKHLRFLKPDICPILDEIIHKQLKYSSSPNGYLKYSRDTKEICQMLENNKIVNPMNRDNQAWYCADVDMGIFAYIQKILLKSRIWNNCLPIN